MKKTINIDGKDITFRMNAAFPIVYKNNFGNDILVEVLPIISDVLKGLDEIYAGEEKLTPSAIGYVLENVYSVELNSLLNMVWTMAYLENKDIKEASVWFAEFEEFPIYDILKELAPMVLESFISKKKLKNLEEIMKVKKKQSTQK